MRGTEAGFFLQHLSRVNPSRVNGTLVAMDQPKHLADGDVIELGGALRLTFHDLAAGDRISGIVPNTGLVVLNDSALLFFASCMYLASLASEQPAF